MDSFQAEKVSKYDMKWDQNYDTQFCNLQQERRGSHPYWYGFKRVGRRIYKQYLGRHHRLTLHRLEEAAACLSARCYPMPGQR